MSHRIASSIIAFGCTAIILSLRMHSTVAEPYSFPGSRASAFPVDMMVVVDSMELLSSVEETGLVCDIHVVHIVLHIDDGPPAERDRL